MTAHRRTHDLAEAVSHNGRLLGTCRACGAKGVRGQDLCPGFQLPDVPAIETAFLVRVYERLTGKTVDAGIYSESHPTISFEYRSEVLHQAREPGRASEGAYERAFAKLRRLVDSRPELAWVKRCKTYRTQMRPPPTSIAAGVATSSNVIKGPWG